MQETLHICPIQSSLFWEDKKKNLAHFENIFTKLAKPFDIIVLPEMFSTGFTMHPKPLAESMTGKTVEWMRKWACTLDAAICGSIIIKEGTFLYNRCIFVKPNGSLQYYDKKNTFTLAGEHKVFTAGKDKVIVAYKGWNIALFICYDLRFPVWSRNTEDYDIAIYVASWPKKRIHAWSTLLQARAIENMCYTIGVNRIGADGNGQVYNGCSAVIDPLGKTLSTIEAEKEYSQGIILTKSKLIETRKKLGFLDDRETFVLK